MRCSAKILLLTSAFSLCLWGGCSNDEEEGGPAPSTLDASNDTSGGDVTKDTEDTGSSTGDSSADTQADTSTPPTPECTEAADCGDILGELAVCMAAACQEGVCVAASEDGEPCDDGNTCTEETVCTAGECAGGQPMNCDDSNPCTEDSCQGGQGCVYEYSNGTTCEDGNDCTENDACLQGKCWSGVNTCTEDCFNGEDDTGEGDVDCEDAQCAALPECLEQCVPGEETLGCGDVLSIDFAEASGTGYVSAWPCAGGAAYSGAEWVWPVTVTDYSDVFVSVSGDVSGSQLFFLDPGDSSAVCDPSDCQEASSSEVSFSLAPAQMVYVVLDSQEDASGTVEVSVECSACVPECTGKQCGADGCGGDCGTCISGQKCVSGGLCVTTPDNEECANADYLLLDTLPVLVEGSTEGADNDYALEPDSECEGANNQGLGFGVGDVVYQLQPPETAEYVIALHASFNGALYILSSCDDEVAGCEAAANGIGAESDVIVTTLSKGVVYYIVVDGFGGSEEGPFILTVNQTPCSPTVCDSAVCGPDGCGQTCGSCAAGLACTFEGSCIEPVANDSCVEATLINTVPYQVSGSTESATDQSWDVCSGVLAGAGASEVFYRFVAPEGALYRASLTAGADYSALLSVGTECPPSFTSCLAGGSTAAGGSTQVDFALTQGEAVWVLVDGVNEGDSGTYELSIEEVACNADCTEKACGPDGCGGSCGSCGVGSMCTSVGSCVVMAPNDTCETATVIQQLPFNDLGSTEGALADYSLSPGVCPQGGPDAAVEGKGNDVVYRYTSPVEQQVLFHFDPLQTLYKTYLYVLGDCSDPSLFCVASPPATVTGGESVVVSMEAGQTVYIIVDGLFSYSLGQYLFLAEKFTN